MEEEAGYECAHTHTEQWNISSVEWLFIVLVIVLPCCWHCSEPSLHARLSSGFLPRGHQDVGGGHSGVEANTLCVRSASP